MTPTTDISMPLGVPPDCGEGCGRKAQVMFGRAELTYCGECLLVLVRLGRQFVDAIDNAEDELGKVIR